MRWGFFFLLWMASVIYFVDSCLDYVRVWQNPPPGFTREQIEPHMQTCAEQKSLRLAGTTVVLAGLYWASGRALGTRKRGPEQG